MNFRQGGENMKRFKKYQMALLVLVLSIPIVSFAASEASGSSGLEVAKYKMEGATVKDWTDLPIQNATGMNTFDISITKTGTTIVTLYAEDKVGNQNYAIKAFTLSGDNSDAPVKTIQYKLSGAVTQDWTTYTGPFVITEEGETYLEVKVIDEAGNVTNAQQTIRLDKTSPVNARAVISLE